MDEILPQERALPTMKGRTVDPVNVRTDSIQASPAARSFDDLFLKHWSSIYRLLVRMTGDPAEAEDLALETFFKLYRQPPKTGDGYNPGGWLYRVATNLGLRSIRSFKRREQYELAAGKNALGEAPENRPTEIFEKKEDQRLAQLALARMNPRRAELLVLRYSGLAYKEIAKTLHLAPTSIGPLLLRAEREFEKIYRTLVQEEP
jgi:RNA polymerase sigma-70 factor (ECF subfamily)